MKILKIAAIISTVLLAGCTTPGHVDMPVISQHENTTLEKKVVAYEITYKAPKSGIFSDGEELPEMDISEANLSFKSRQVFNEFNRVLSSQLPSNALVANKKSFDYKLVTKIVAHNSDGPTYVENQYLETFFKNVASLGMTADEQLVIADFEITYIILDHKGNELLSKTYDINDKVEHERSDFEYTNETGKALGGQLLEKHISITLNELMKELSSKSV